MKSRAHRDPARRTERRRARSILTALCAAATVSATAEVRAGDACLGQWVPALDGAAGVDNEVLAITVWDDGTGPALYVGGNFSTAGGVSASRIAKWDGSTWSPLADGLNLTVRDFAIFDDGSGEALYACGNFHSSGSPPGNVNVNRFARWDGSQWTAPGLVGNTNGMSSSVHTLQVFDDGSGPAIYAGGTFGSAGGAPASRIARWDGWEWSQVGLGLNHTVEALTVFDDGTGPSLYAGGQFGIAKWDGNEWTTLTAPIIGIIYALVGFDDGSGPALYAGGSLDNAGGIPGANRIARWDGTQWSAVGGGLNNRVESLHVFDDGTGPALYAGGLFSASGDGATLNGIGRWDGVQWTSLGSGMNNWVNVLYGHDTEDGPALFVGGWFNDSPAGDAYLARWQGCDTASCPASDLNGDNTVSVADLLIVLAAWGPCDNPRSCPADFNSDGMVNVADLLIVFADWGPCD